MLGVAAGRANAVIPCVREGKVLNQAIEPIRMHGIIPMSGFIPPTEIDPALWPVEETMPLGEVQKGSDSVYDSDNIAVLLKP